MTTMLTKTLTDSVVINPTDRDYFEPRPVQCSHCDFGLGQRGMDRCGKCNGTGSVFWVAGQRFSNTERGYLAARAILSGCS